MITEKQIIRCPFCGAEYVPSEIYYPDDFLPDVSDLTKDAGGKIIACASKPMNLEEEYVCDYCGHAFTAVADVVLSAKKCEEHDFGFDYSAPIYDRPRTELKED